MSAKDWLEVDGFALHPPSTPAMISEAEARLGVTFPKDLRDLILTADGVFDCAGEYDVFWPLVRIVQENLTAWECDGLPRTQWLGFGDDGTGSPFCVSTLGGNEVAGWSPIDGEATILADSSRTFWLGWINGAIHT